MRFLGLASALLIIATPSAVSAQLAGAKGPTYSGPPASIGSGHLPRPILDRRFVTRINALRSEGLALREADGGTLSDGHRQMLQTRLDSLRSGYRRDLANADPFAVDSYGLPNPRR